MDADDAAQSRLDDLGTPLHAVTFVVVDLETTGGSPHDSRITEVGAVKVRGGKLLGELATLVDPGLPIPAGISALTGITDAMVAAFPPVEAVLPAFLEFCRGAILVAHNARFDVGFLNASCARLDYPNLDRPVVCTAALARRLVRDEVRNCTLATLAEHFRCRTRPVHRALADARATVEVLHGLLERAGSFGVVTDEDLIEFARVRNAPLFKARRHLADDLPRAPGVYAFRADGGAFLYVGKATDLRARVRRYFGGDDRRRITDLVRETASVDHWLAPTPVEATIRELRLIAEHRPHYNHRSKTPPRDVWLKVTRERFPRLSVVGSVRDDGAAYIGPLASRRIADRVAEAVLDVVPLRRCTARIGPRTRFPACALAEMGRCLAPCDGRVDPEAYAPAVADATDALTIDPEPVLSRLARRMHALGETGRFEEAAGARDRIHVLVSALARSRRLQTVTAPTELIVSRPSRTAGHRDVVVVHDGRLAASLRCPAAQADVAALRLRDEAPPPPAAAPALVPLTEEINLVGSWLEGPGARVHHCEGTLASPVAGGRVLAAVAARLSRSRRTTGRPDVELAAKRLRR